jgi:hypothetical protein
MKVLPERAELFHAGRETERKTDMAKLIAKMLLVFTWPAGTLYSTLPLINTFLLIQILTSVLNFN